MRLAVLLFLAVSLPTTARAQDPAELGPFSTSEWDVGSLMVAGRTVTEVVVSYPEDGGERPIVGVFHGYEGESGDHALLNRTLASYGMVSLSATLPCRIATGCDHTLNAGLILGLLDWLVTEGDRAGGPHLGRIDGARRGPIGHSFGALTAHIAGTMDERIGSIVLLDPNDDAGVPGRLATASTTAPTAQLLAERPGSCNALWDEGAITPMLPAPRLELTVDRSGHCDPSDVTDALCMLGCGTGDRSTSPVFRRYAVAWTACHLTGAPAMADWLGGTGMADDTASGTIVGVRSEGLEDLGCRGGEPLVDAGPPPDAGPSADAGGDDVGSADDGGATMDAGATDDASLDVDGGAPITSSGGCACRATGASARSSIAQLVLVLAIAVLGARRALLRPLTSR